MILSFKEEFNPKITKGQKIHTLRRDKKRRWKKGNKVHFANNLRSPNYRQFGEGECKMTFNISIIHFPFINGMLKSPEVIIEGITMSKSELKAFAFRDGFNTLDEFWAWFDHTGDYIGISWVNLRIGSDRYMDRGFCYNVRSLFKGF
jgi:hypothetical protein